MICWLSCWRPWVAGVVELLVIVATIPQIVATIHPHMATCYVWGLRLPRVLRVKPFSIYRSYQGSSSSLALRLIYQDTPLPKPNASKAQKLQ